MGLACQDRPFEDIDRVLLTWRSKNVLLTIGRFDCRIALIKGCQVSFSCPSASNVDKDRKDRQEIR